MEDETVSAVIEFAKKTDLICSMMNSVQFIDPKLNNESDVLKKVLFYVTTVVSLDDLENVASYLHNEATTKEEACKQLEALVGSLDLEGEE